MTQLAPPSAEEWRIAVPGAVLAGCSRPAAHGDERPPLVCLHGFGGTWRDWDTFAAALGPDHPLVRYDLRGFGRSTTTPEAIYSHADDLAALLDGLGHDRVDLCGMSLGGATALSFALDHPSRVRRLVLISPLMVGWLWSEDWIERWKAMGRAARSGDMAQARRLWWEHPLFSATRESPAAEQMHRAIEAYHGQQWIADPQRRDPPDLDRLQSLEPPTLLLTGGRDIADFRQIAAAIETHGPKLVRKDYPAAGHMLNIEIPGLIAQDASRFLAT